MSDEELATAVVDRAVDAAIDDAIAHLRTFNEAQLAHTTGWTIESEPGLTVGEKIGPDRVGRALRPVGQGVYPSVAYQLAVPAVVAGVPEIVARRPAGARWHRARIDPAVLVVCRKLGIEQVFRVNGPAGVAALGFGTESIPKVRKVVGPGSPAVTIAQVEMQRHGVATMMLLGPTESLVIADHTADPVRLAADLLIEAEHGADSPVVLSPRRRTRRRDRRRARSGRSPTCPTSAPTRRGVARGQRRLRARPDARRRGRRRQPLRPRTPAGRGRRRLVDHVVDGLVNAGEILIGQHTPFSAANFVIGCPASLPTSGFAHVSSGITADAFLKRTAIARADQPGDRTDGALGDRARRPRGIPRALSGRPPAPGSERGPAAIPAVPRRSDVRSMAR